MVAPWEWNPFPKWFGSLRRQAYMRWFHWSAGHVLTLHRIIDQSLCDPICESGDIIIWKWNHQFPLPTYAIIFYIRNTFYSILRVKSVRMSVNSRRRWLPYPNVFRLNRQWYVQLIQTPSSWVHVSKHWFTCVLVYYIYWYFTKDTYIDCKNSFIIIIGPFQYNEYPFL